MKKISVCIPAYEMSGKGAEFLRHSLDVLARQDFKDFDVVVSDHSSDEAMKAVCDSYSGKMDIAYLRNEKNRGNSSSNLNNAIRNASGKIIKILFQDDFLFDERSLGRIADAFDPSEDAWLAASCTHTKDGRTFFRTIHPRYDDAGILFKNTMSSPSVIAIRNDRPLLFDEKLIWYMDVDYYKRCFARFGQPKIVDDVCVVNRVGGHQISSTLVSERLKEREFIYIADKFKLADRKKLVQRYRMGRLRRQAKGIIRRILGKR